MIRKKIIVLVMGVLLILYLILGTYLSSSVLSFTTEKLKEKCLWQARYIRADLDRNFYVDTGVHDLKETQGTPSQDWEPEDLKEISRQLSAKYHLKVEIITHEPENMEEELRQAFAGREGTRITNSEKGRELLIAQPLSPTTILRTTHSMNEIQQQEEKVRYGIIVAALIYSLVAFLILRKLIAKQMKPLEQISDSMEEYLQGQEGVRLPLNDNGEFGMLTYGFNTLADNYSDKKMELEREKYKNSLILNNMDNAMAVIDKDGKLVECNRSFTEWFNVVQGGESEAYSNMLSHTKIQGFLHQCLQEKDGRSITFNMIRNNKKKVFRVFGAPMYETFQPYPTMVLTVFHDITAMQEVYDKQTAFVSNASHELSTPLTTIRGFADTLLEDDTGSDPHLRQQFLTIILEEAKRMQSLIKDLLQLAKLDQEDYRQNMVMVDFQVEPVFLELEREFGDQAQKRGLSLQVGHQDLLAPAQVYANRDWFKQILVNLVENAMKYTPQGGSIDVTYNRQPDQVEFIVHNSGEGISPEERRRIFDRFYRIDKARSRAQGGSGLGLSIVKFIVEILGGTIRVESNPGEGVSFIFTLLRRPKETDK